MGVKVGVFDLLRGSSGQGPTQPRWHIERGVGLRRFDVLGCVALAPISFSDGSGAFCHHDSREETRLAAGFLSWLSFPGLKTQAEQGLCVDAGAWT